MNINLPLFGNRINKKQQQKTVVVAIKKTYAHTYKWTHTHVRFIGEGLYLLECIRDYFHFLISIIDYSSFIATKIIEKKAHTQI